MENQNNQQKSIKIENNQSNQSVKSNSNNNQSQYTSDKDAMFRLMYDYKIDSQLMQ